MAVVEKDKWKVFYNTTSDYGEVDLERRVQVLQDYVSIIKQVKRPKTPFEIVVSAKKNYTKVEYSGKDYSLEFDSESRDGSNARLQISCRVGADGLLRYAVRISDVDMYHYQIIPQRVKKE